MMLTAEMMITSMLLVTFYGSPKQEKNENHASNSGKSVMNDSG